MNIVFLGIDLVKNVFQLCGRPARRGNRFIRNALAEKNCPDAGKYSCMPDFRSKRPPGILLPQRV